MFVVAIVNIFKGDQVQRATEREIAPRRSQEVNNKYGVIWYVALMRAVPTSPRCYASAGRMLANGKREREFVFEKLSNFLLEFFLKEREFLMQNPDREFQIEIRKTFSVPLKAHTFIR